MLKPKVLGEVLSQANTGGVTNTLYVITWHAEEKAMLSQLKDMALTMQELCASLSHQVPPSTSRLLSPEGLVVAWSGEKGTAEKDAKVTSAIAFHIWQAYQSNTPQSFSANGPDVLLLNCEVRETRALRHVVWPHGLSIKDGSSRTAAASNRPRYGRQFGENLFASMFKTKARVDSGCYAANREANWPLPG
jgi:hypothetical protein